MITEDQLKRVKELDDLIELAEKDSSIVSNADGVFTINFIKNSSNYHSVIFYGLDDLEVRKLHAKILGSLREFYANRLAELKKERSFIISE